MKISSQQMVTIDTSRKSIDTQKKAEAKDLVDIGTSANDSPGIYGPDIKSQKSGPAGEPISGGSLTGDIRLHRNFHSDVLNNDRDVVVYLPPGYSENDHEKKYPVLYMQDGQNLFNRETSFGGVEWGVDETAERLIRQGEIEDVIIVGIYNNGDRMSEYTPVPDPHHGGGNLDKYASFVTEELKPFIDKIYNTKETADETSIGGSSLGGLSSIRMSWKLANAFGRGVIGMSPSLWWADEWLTKEIEKDPKTKGPAKIWLDMGTNEAPIWFEIDEKGMDKLKDKFSPEKLKYLEPLTSENLEKHHGKPSKDEVKEYLTNVGFNKEETATVLDYSVWNNDENRNDIPDTLDHTRKMGEAFLKKGYKLGSELFYYEMPGGAHCETDWKNRFELPLKFIFGKNK